MSLSFSHIDASVCCHVFLFVCLFFIIFSLDLYLWSLHLFNYLPSLSLFHFSSDCPQFMKSLLSHTHIFIYTCVCVYVHTYTYNLMNPLSFACVYAHPGLFISDWTIYADTPLWRKVVLPLLSHWQPITLLPGVGPSGIFPISGGVSTRIVIMLVLFRQPYSWGFMGAFFSSYLGDSLTAGILGVWLLQSFLPIIHYFSLSFRCRGWIADLLFGMNTPTVHFFWLSPR